MFCALQTQYLRDINIFYYVLKIHSVDIALVRK
jgi:hypothetical protein